MGLGVVRTGQVRAALAPSSNLQQEDRDYNPLKKSEVLSPGSTSLLQSQVDIKKGRRRR